MWRRKDGRYVTRECVCKCGREFTQRQVSKKFVDKSLRPFGNALAQFQALAPTGFLPLNCIPCERRALWLDHVRDEDVL